LLDLLGDKIIVQMDTAISHLMSLHGIKHSASTIEKQQATQTTMLRDSTATPQIQISEKV